MKHFITYKVHGFKGEKFENNETEDSVIKIGPINPEDLNYQLFDLKGYEGVYDVETISE